VDFGSFKRDVLMFKTLAVAQLLILYFYPQGEIPFSVDYVSLLMMGSGMTLSIMATNALGIERTYFGVELGICEPKWITQFPYG